MKCDTKICVSVLVEDVAVKVHRVQNLYAV